MQYIVFLSLLTSYLITYKYFVRLVLAQVIQITLFESKKSNTSCVFLQALQKTVTSLNTLTSIILQNLGLQMLKIGEFVVATGEI